MIGFNGGLIGVRRTSTSTTATGLWSQNEQSVAKRAGAWPISPNAQLVMRQLSGQANIITQGQIGDFYGQSVLWFHKFNAGGEENYIGTVIQAAVLGQKPYSIGIANALSPQNVITYTVDEVSPTADDPANNIFYIDYTGPVLNLDNNTYIFSALP